MNMYNKLNSSFLTNNDSFLGEEPKYTARYETENENHYPIV